MIKKTAFASLIPPLTNVLVYEVPRNKTAEMVMLWITNTAGTNKTIEVSFYNAATDTTLVFLDGFVVNTNEFTQIGGEANTFVMLDEGDKLMAKGEANSDFKVIASLIENNKTVIGG